MNTAYYKAIGKAIRGQAGHLADFIEKNPDGRQEFIKIESFNDGKGGDIMINTAHIVSIRHYLYGETRQLCLEFRLIDGSDVRITDARALRLFNGLRKFFSVWE